MQSYLSIMQLRLGEKLQFSIDVPENLLAIRFPSLLLQTLVENAIVHGIEPVDRPGTISIRATRADNMNRLTVADDGAGFSVHGNEHGHGVGLRNVRDRLATFYEGHASFEIGPGAASGTEAVLVIPAETV